jgi:cyclopropane fatty-acyl-phospholipid synthase-like methyltransferase/methyltransferase-like protein
MQFIEYEYCLSGGVRVRVRKSRNYNNSMTAQEISPYDTQPYPRLPFAQSHPNRLATMATVFGMNPPDVRVCRVLEIGCASGGNLIPMAEQLPGSQFIGFDLSQIQVDSANAWIEELGLRNIQVQRLDIADASNELGEFDYILCHGVYSWVAAETQATLLELASKHLSPNGIAYISYNTNPGWHVRGIVRDIMLFHSQGTENTREKIVQAQQLLGFLVQNVPATDPYGMLLRIELDTLSRKADEYVEHEYFETDNHPVYFHEFAASLAAHQLRYVCEADVESTFRGDVPRETLQKLERISADEIRLEQYLDFLRKRTFRQSLVCHSDKTPRRTLEPTWVDRAFLESLLLRTQSPTHFRNRFSGISLAIDDPELHCALSILAELNRSNWVFGDLVAEVQRIQGVQVDESKLRRMFLQAFASGHLELHTAQPQYGYDWSGLPRASRCARSQAALGTKVTSLSHHNVVLTELDRIILLLLDGKTPVEEIASRVRTEMATRSEHVDFAANSLDEAIQMSLRNLARMRLLFGR